MFKSVMYSSLLKKVVLVFSILLVLPMLTINVSASYRANANERDEHYVQIFAHDVSQITLLNIVVHPNLQVNVQISTGAEDLTVQYHGDNDNNITYIWYDDSLILLPLITGDDICDLALHDGILLINLPKNLQIDINFGIVNNNVFVDSVNFNGKMSFALTEVHLSINESIFNGSVSIAISNGNINIKDSEFNCSFTLALAFETLESPVLIVVNDVFYP